MIKDTRLLRLAELYFKWRLNAQYTARHRRRRRRRRVVCRHAAPA